MTANHPTPSISPITNQPEFHVPVLSQPDHSCFYRLNELTLTGRAKRVDLTPETYAAIRVRKGTVENEEKEFCKIQAEICSRLDGKCIGYVTSKVFRLSDDYYSPDEIVWTFDSLDQDGYDFAYEVVTENAVNLYELCDNSNFVIIDRVEVLQGWRGKGIGIAALKAVAERARQVEKAAVCFLKPVPLQFRIETVRQAPDEASLLRYQTELQKLTAYYERTLPIKRVTPKSNFYFFRLPIKQPRSATLNP